MTLTAAPDTRPAPAEPTTPIKPSEAIRLGCLIAPVQNKYTFFEGKGSACVLGAMALGLGYRGWDGADAFDLVQIHIPHTLTDPANGYRSKSISALTSLNDLYGWTREAIADWLAEQGL